MANMTRNTSKTLDFYYNAFDILGYSKSLAEKRIVLHEKVIQQIILRGKRWHGTTGNVNLLIAGSRGEGCGIFSDVDILFVLSFVKCFENVPTSLTQRPLQAVFQLDFKDVPNGYTKIKLIRIDDLDRPRRKDDTYLVNITAALVQNNDSYYLKNDQLLIHDMYHFLYDHIATEAVFADINGPARSFMFGSKCLNLSMDLVQAFPCSCPSVVDDWCNRTRKYNWPSRDLIETVKGLDVLVVPVGKKDATDEVLQWRISQTLGEQALVRSFNDPQIKIYVALKMLVNHELKPLCQNITSYVIKNIIFWVFEKSRLLCTKNDFLEILLYSLQYLKVRIVWRYLPTYMMPSRNLLESKVSEREKAALEQRLNDMLGEGYDVLLRCPLVNEMSKLPSIRFQEKLIYRELSEQIYLSVVAFPSADIKLYAWFLSELKCQNKERFFQNWIVAILPYIWRSNPLGFFNRMISMSEEEIIFRLVEGWKLGYNKE